MKTNQSKIICTFVYVCVLMLAMVACTEKNTKAPPKDQVRDAIGAALPPFIAVEGIELEPISTSHETSKINFKATVYPKEDLYREERNSLLFS